MKIRPTARVWRAAATLALAAMGLVAWRLWTAPPQISRRLTICHAVTAVRVSVRVVDATKGSPLPGARVTVAPTGFDATSPIGDEQDFASVDPSASDQLGFGVGTTDSNGLAAIQVEAGATWTEPSGAGRDLEVHGLPMHFRVQARGFRMLVDSIELEVLPDSRVIDLGTVRLLPR